MKKKYFWFILLLLFFAVFLFGKKVFFRYPSVGNEKEDKILGLQEESPTLKVKISSGEYYFDYFFADSDSLFLFPNFTLGEKGESIRDKFDCKYITSGGFYDKDFKPIGLFISEYEEISPWQKNDLFNGVFSINMLGTARITRERPRDSLRLAVQSGPLVFENAAKVNIRSSPDRYRRIVVGVTGENRPLFLVFYGLNNFIEGPTLEELPDLIDKVNSDYNLGIADAINLDGGNASLFYSEKTKLSELVKIGSFFCFK